MFRAFWLILILVNITAAALIAGEFGMVAAIPCFVLGGILGVELSRAAQ